MGSVQILFYFQHELSRNIYFRVYQGQNIYFHPQQNFEKAKIKKKNNGGGVSMLVQKGGRTGFSMFVLF